MIEFPLYEALFFAAGALTLGILMLVRGGSWMIDAAVYIARHFGIPPLIIGFTIVAFCTSLPELVVSVNANLTGLPGIAIGNVVGSNIANMLLVIGMTAFVATIVIEKSPELRRDLGVMLLATFAFMGLMVTDHLTRVAGMGLVIVLVSYTFWQYWTATHDEHGGDDYVRFRSLPYSFIFLIAGLLLIVLGAEFLVRGAKLSAEIIGVPDAVIGLTVIALGTSLPELTTCLIAVAKKQHGIVIGNIIGSNVFNILMIVGFSTLAKSIPSTMLAPQLLSTDIWVLGGISVIFATLLLFAKRLGRLTGMLFLCAYLGYIISVYILGLSSPQG